MTTVSRAS